MSTMKLIQKVEVTTTGVTSIVLNSGGAWSEYTDLKLLISARLTSTSGNYSVAYHHVNNVELSSGATGQLYGTGSVASAHGVFYPYTQNSNNISNTFSNGEIYYANASSSTQHKEISADWVNEADQADTIHWIGHSTYASNTPITRIDYVQYSSQIAVGSTFTLYGITAGDDGTTTVS